MDIRVQNNFFMRKSLSFIFFISFFPTLLSAGALDKLVDIQIGKPVKPAAAERSDLMFYQSVYYYNIEDFQKSYAFAMEAVKQNPNNGTAYYQLSRLLGKSDQLQEARKVLLKAYILDSTNILYINDIASISYRLQDYRVALQFFERLCKITPNDLLAQKGLLQTAYVSKSYDVVINKVEELKRKGMYDDQVFHFHLETLRDLKLDSKADTLCIQYYNNTYSAYPAAQMAKTYIGRYDYAKAKTWIDKAETIDPELVDLILVKIEYYDVTKQWESLFNVLSDIILDESANRDLKFDFLESFVNKNEFTVLYKDRIDTLFSQIVPQYRSLSAFDYIYSRWLFLSVGGERSAKYIQGVLNEFITDTLRMNSLRSSNKSNQLNTNQEAFFRMYQFLIEYYLGAGKYESAIKYVDDALELFGQNVLFIFYKARALSASGREKLAIDYFNKANAMISPQDSVLKSHVLSSMADVYYRMNDKSKAFKIYREALNYNINDPMINNNFAYYLSENNKDLEFALECVKIALGADQNNVTYLDTYAWVLFKMQLYYEAREQYRKIMVLMKDSDATIFEHYGDVLRACGDLPNAKVYWNKAIENGAKLNLSEKIR